MPAADRLPVGTPGGSGRWEVRPWVPRWPGAVLARGGRQQPGGLVSGATVGEGRDDLGERRPEPGARAAARRSRVAAAGSGQQAGGVGQRPPGVARTTGAVAVAGRCSPAGGGVGRAPGIGRGGGGQQLRPGRVRPGRTAAPGDGERFDPPPVAVGAGGNGGPARNTVARPRW
jgi:hypothetical protein